MTDDKRIIKKYPNRRLYDTATSCYITLEDVKQLVLEHVSFQIIDAKSGDDLTRTILLQIILEEESGGIPMFTSEMLAQIIRFYGHAMQGLMGNYLEKNIEMFIQMQQRLQEQSRHMYGDNPMMSAETWGQFLKFQAPAIQGLMSSYLEQSTNMFVEMQQRLNKQTRSLFSSFPFTGFPSDNTNPFGVWNAPPTLQDPDKKK